MLHNLWLKLAIAGACTWLSACSLGDTNSNPSGNVLASGNYTGQFNPSVYLGPKSSPESFSAVVTNQGNTTLVTVTESNTVIFTGTVLWPFKNNVCLVTTPPNSLVTNGWSQTAQVGNISFAYCQITQSANTTTVSASYFYTLITGQPYPINGGMSGTLTMTLQQ